MPKLTLAQKVSRAVPDIRKAYGGGKRRYEVDGVIFRVRRGGPGNNFLMISPIDKSRLTPVINTPYDERKERDRMELKAAKSTALAVRPAGMSAKKFQMLQDKRRG